MLRAARRPDVVAQVILLAIVAALLWQGWLLVTGGLDQVSAKSGYDFLFEPAPFQIGESLLPFQAGEPYWMAFAAGLSNTLQVAVLGIVLSTLVGLVAALGQLSPSVVIAGICRAYVEAARNVPLLLQLIFWHTFLTRSLPNVRQAASPAEGVYLTNRGLYLPAPTMGPGMAAGLVAVALGGLACVLLLRARRARRMAGKETAPLGWLALCAPVLAVTLAWLVFGAPMGLDRPALSGFNFQGGLSLSPEFAAMLIGLTLYVGSFNAEIIRAGILGIPKGQREAALALGLTPWQTMRKVILPQAMRIILPALTNSYLNLTKESSLAVAIGYPELVRVSNIALAETGQSVECISIMMTIYLCLSLITSLILRQLEKRARLVER